MGRKHVLSESNTRTTPGQRWLWCPTAAVFTLLTGQSALANPDGAQIVAGEVTLTQRGATLNVNQSSERAVVDWRSFNIAANEHTRFEQPSTSSVTLNRVRGGELSQIHGGLSANGQVYLVNPNGLLFGKDAKVSVGALVATTSDISDADFLASRYRFDGESAGDASVTNLGEITVADGGAILLAAPSVRNEGRITARLGTVELAGGSTFTVDFDGDGLLAYDVGHVDAQNATVSNSGFIGADGGVVALTAQGANAVTDRVINMDGVIQAQSVGVRNGRIVLDGGDTGIVAVSGALDATGRDAGQTGGRVAVLGDKVGLFDGAQVSADGHQGGGEVLIGGNFQGAGSEPNASQTYVAAGASINANALAAGDGGRVIVWADGATQYYGDIEARGAAAGGDGGFVEVSGKHNLGFHGTVSVDAPTGEAGTVLLDPDFIVIDVGAGTPVAGGDLSVPFGDPTAVMIISEDALEGLTGNIVLQANQDIAIESGLNGGGLNLSTGERFVMQAGRSIVLDSSIETAGASVHLEADSPHALVGAADGTGVLSTGAGVRIDTNGGAVTLIAADYTGMFGTVISTLNGDINVAPSSSALNIDAFGTFANVQTGGRLTFGQATSAGANGLGGGTVITATDTTSDNPILSAAQSTLFIATNDIRATGGQGIEALGNRSVSLQAGNDIVFVAPSVVMDLGSFDATAGGLIDIPLITTMGGNVNLQGGTIDTPAIGTLGGDVNVQGGGLSVEAVVTNGGAITLVGDTVTINRVPPSVLVVGGPLPPPPPGVVNSGAGDLSITADTLTFDGALVPGTFAGSGALVIQPRTPGQGIGLGSATAGMDLSQAELALFSPTFSDLIIGRADGQHDIDIQSVTFSVPATIRTLNGGSITVSAGLNAVEGLSLLGSGATTSLSGPVSTDGTPIVITGPITLAADATLNTTFSAVGVPPNANGADITIGDVTNLNDNVLTINAGLLGNVGGQGIQSAGAQSAGVVSIVNSATTSFAGDVVTGQFNITDTQDSVTFNGALTSTGTVLDANGILGAASPLATTAPGAYAILMNGGGQLGQEAATGLLSPAFPFANTGGVTIANPTAPMTFVGGLDSSSGPTFLGGTVIATGPIVTDALTLSADGTLNGTSIALGQVTAAGNGLTLDTGGATAVALLDAGNDFATVAANTGALTLVDVNAIDIGAATVAGNLNVTAGGAITDSGDLTVAGTSSFTATAAPIVLDNANNVYGGNVAVTNTGNNNVLLSTSGALALTANLGSGSASVTTTAGVNASISQAANAGEVLINAGAGPIGLTSNVTGVLNLQNTGANSISITSGPTLQLGTVTTGGDLTVDAGGTVGGDLVTGALTVGGNLALTASGTLVAGPAFVTGTTTMNAIGLVTLASATVTGDFAVATAGDILANGPLNLATAASFSSGAGAITLGDAANTFGDTLTLINAGNNNVVIAAAGTLQIDATVGSGELFVAGNGVTATVTQAANAGATNVAGGTGAVVLTGILTGATTVSNSGANGISIDATGPLNLLSATSGGALNVTSGGALSLAAATVANDLILTAAGTLDVGATTGGGAVSLTATDAVTLAALTATGDFAVSTAGDILAAGPLTLGGNSVFNAGDGAINLTDAGNAFAGNMSLLNTGNNDVTVVAAGELAFSATVGSGAFTVTANGLRQTGALLQAANATAASFDAGAGAIDFSNLANDLSAPVSLTTTGAGDITIATNGLLNLADATLTSGTLTVTAADLGILGPLAGSGALVLQPTLDQAIGLGAGAGEYTLNVAELANLTDGFARINIGRAGYAGTVAIADAQFVDPLVIDADGLGAEIFISGTLRGLGDASITLNGSGATTNLGGGIVTNGGAITINDAVRLTADSLLSTTPVGGAITLGGGLDGANFALAVSGGLLTNLETAPLAVARLSVDGAGGGAAVFGRVEGLDGRAAAGRVTGVSDDPAFLINGCAMGTSCESQERRAIAKLPPAELFASIAGAELLSVWGRQLRLRDPRDSSYSNFGNEELWWEHAPTARVE